MASAMPPPTLRPLFIQHRSTRFLIYRTKNLLHRFTIYGCTRPTHRFPFLSYSHSPPLRSPLALCPRLFLSHPPLLSLLRPRSPSPRFPSLSSMTTPQASSDSFPPNQTKTVRVVIKGMVQGVFYRNWTVENASQLGLKGWIRNRRDGSVEALFSGSPDTVQEMEQRCRRGPPAAMVTGLQIFPSNEDPGTGFERKPTV